MTRPCWNTRLTDLRNAVDALTYSRDCEGDTEELCRVAECLAALAPATDLSAGLENTVADVRHGISLNAEEARRAA
jgi:hypothetical protein